MPATLPLRPYQLDAIRSIRKGWQKHRSVAAVLPTGAGKTVVMAHLAAEEHASDATRTLVIVHTDELIGQTLDKFRQVAPHLSAGVIQGQRREDSAQLMVGTIQTLRGDGVLNALRSEPLLTIVDECHHATAKSYQTVLSTLSGQVLGLTATLSRSDGAALGEVFDAVVYRRDIRDMIKAGYLVSIHGVRVRIPDLDLSDVKTTRGEYQADELEDALSAALAPELTAKAYVEHAGLPDGSYRKGILFAPTVASAYEFAQALNDAGVPTETIHGALPKADRRAILHRLHTGETTVVANCMVLTEGFDEPSASCVVIARPTTSQGLYVQMAGRGLRLSPGKSDCLLLDVVGVTGRHRLAGPVDLMGDVKRERAPEIEDLTDFVIDGDGLTFEGEEEESASAGGRGLFYVHGDEVESRRVDLFAASHSAWLQTTGGAWFLPAGGRGPSQLYVTLVPNADTYNVAVMNPYGHGTMRYRAIDLDAAMAWGEEVAKETGASALINRKGAWRRKGVEPTQAQIDTAVRMGLHVDGMSKAEVSDAITVAKASAVIDKVMRGMGA